MKILVHQTKEQYGYFYRGVTIEIHESGGAIKTIETKESLLEINNQFLTVYDQAPTGQDSGVQRGDIKLRIDMSKVFQFERRWYQGREEYSYWS